MKHIHAASILAALSLAALPALAGVKYWDNPDFKAFDVGDYVQDGLVVNYDGIRNAGPNADHDPEAETWVNCVNSTKWPLLWCSYIWNESTSKYDWKKSNTSEGAWANDGFVFDGLTYFAKWNDGNPVALGPDYSYQFGTDGTISTQKQNTQYLIVPSSNWDKGGVGLRKSAGGGTTANSVYGIDTTLNSTRPYFTAAGGKLGYVSYIVDYSTTKKEYITDGASIPTASGTTVAISTTPSKSYTWFSLGGFHSHEKPTAIAELEGFTGTIHFFRIYSKALNSEELGWNRVVDEARYYGRVAPIPVTNAVVTANFPDVSGNTPNGTYAVDASGYTFSAPASVVYKGRTYTLSGYKVETMSNGAWSLKEESDSASAASISVAAGDCVRITWKWAQGDGIVTYDVSDYVQDDLLVHYDGICNVGQNIAHDGTTTKWINLGSGGATYDMKRVQKVAGDQGYWCDDGYRFEGNSAFESGKHDGNWLTYSFQWVVDAKASERKYSPPYLFSAGWNTFAFGMGDNPKAGCFHYNTQGASHRPYILNSAKEYTYATAISDADKKEIKFFEGTTAPTSGGLADGYYKFGDDATMSANTYKADTYTVAGYGSNNGQFVGTIKNIRIYTRVLTDAEIAHNRRVDNWRFFGIYEPETTNVVVLSTYTYLHGNEADGPYEIAGSYTFTAPETVTAENGITYKPDGYTIETWSGTDWVDATKHSGNTYAYTTAAGKVRLTWHWKATYGCRSAADYTIDDLASGAVMHFDGIYNAGIGTHSDSATKWINLGTAGSNLDASLAGSADDSAWTEYGYNFKGKRKFMTPNDASKYIHIARTYTLQSLVDAPYADNIHADGNYILATGWNQGSIQIRGTPKTTWFLTQQASYDNRPRYTETGDAFSYATAILDDAAKTAVVFPGTKAPTSGTVTTGYKQFSSMLDSFDWYVHIGGANLGNGQFLRGTIKSIRYYDRVLTEEELVRNRNVDSARYFGELAVTNVLVTTKYADVAGDEEVLTEAAGAYKVEGRWTFTATKVKGDNGKLKDVAGYYTEELVNGAWTNKAWHEGTSYTYQEGVDAATIRLTWSGPRPGMMIIVK